METSVSNSKSAAILRQFSFVRASDVLKLERICRKQEAPFEHTGDGRSDSSSFRPRLIIFVSHRWETPEHPDPSGRQLQALQMILLKIKELMKSVETNDCSSFLVDSSLLHYGTLHVVDLWYRVLESPFIEGYTNENEDDFVENLSSGNILRDYIGIWYDYLCLPQKPRSGLEDEEFREGLANLSSLISHPTVHTLSLRQGKDKDDDTETRAWCVAEICSAWGLNYQDSDSYAGLRYRYPLALHIDGLLSADKDFPLGVLTQFCNDWQRKSRESDSALFVVLLELMSNLRDIAKDLFQQDDIAHFHCTKAIDKSLFWGALVAQAIGSSTNKEENGEQHVALDLAKVTQTRQNRLASATCRSYQPR